MEKKKNITRHYGHFVLAETLGNTLIVPARKELNPLYFIFF